MQLVAQHCCVATCKLKSVFARVTPVLQVAATCCTIHSLFRAKTAWRANIEIGRISQVILSKKFQSSFWSAYMYNLRIIFVLSASVNNLLRKFQTHQTLYTVLRYEVMSIIFVITHNCTSMTFSHSMQCSEARIDYERVTRLCCEARQFNEEYIYLLRWKH